MLSIVEFAIRRQNDAANALFLEDIFTENCFEKDGLRFFVMGAIGGIDNELEDSGYAMFEDLFDGVDVGGFWQETGHLVEQRIYCVFDVQWKQHDGYEWDCILEYLGVADPTKWTVQSLAVQHSGGGK